jgi:uncharacterized protein
MIRFMLSDRFPRRFVLAAAMAVILAPGLAMAQARGELSLYAGAAGGTFLPYAQALARYLNRFPDLRMTVVESGGSIANLAAVDGDPKAIGLAFIPAVQDAVRGEGFAKGKKHSNLRALMPAFRSTYQIAVRGDSDIKRMLDLDRKRVGVGPAGGTDEILFAVTAKDLFLKPDFVNGTIAELGNALVAGQVDALWVGARSPIPAIADVAARADIRVIGLSAWELAGLVERYQYLTPAIVPANTYRGQNRVFATVASWNLLVVNKDMPEEQALAIVKAIVEAGDPGQMIHPFASETRIEFLSENRVVDYHPALLRYLRERPVQPR